MDNAEPWVTGELHAPMLRRWEWIIDYDDAGMPLSASIVPEYYVPERQAKPLLPGCEEWLWRMTYRDGNAED